MEGRGEVGERMVGREDVMVVVTMEEEVRGLGFGGKVMGVRVVKQEVVEVVEEGGEGCLGRGGGMRVEEESGREERVEEVGKEVEGVDVGRVKMGNEEEKGVDLEVLEDLGWEEDADGVLMIWRRRRRRRR